MENKKGKKEEKIKKKKPSKPRGKEVKRSEARREWGGRAGEGRKGYFPAASAIYTQPPKQSAFRR
jgi:hypothetical protein